MLTRIRNASAAKKPEVVLPYSKLKSKVAEVLRDNSYVGKVEKLGLSRDKKEKVFDQLMIKLNYDESGESVIKNIKKISKPGRRVYTGKDKLPYVLNNLGIAIISTPRGLMTNKEARNKGLGGEIICEVY